MLQYLEFTDGLAELLPDFRVFNCRVEQVLHDAQRFGTDRDDEEWSALLATEHQDWPGKGWTLTPRVRYVEHSSNISLYEYDRWEASLYARRSFR